MSFLQESVGVAKMESRPTSETAPVQAVLTNATHPAINTESSALACILLILSTDSVRN